MINCSLILQFRIIVIVQMNMMIMAFKPPLSIPSPQKPNLQMGLGLVCDLGFGMEGGKCEVFESFQVFFPLISYPKLNTQTDSRRFSDLFSSSKL
ncbi:hypothetical protein Lalb_Chr25g0278841 [Lupinus albus]|uniref:Uncharacterized protein n=1 Tax=Lupinus albus TaxID=3870 RepID=A0A6A4MJM3_LUPAL|nr:hypothetical protein Lalb_Chr25g0278841 [Lupinus albus]